MYKRLREESEAAKKVNCVHILAYSYMSAYAPIMCKYMCTYMLICLHRNIYVHARLNKIMSARRLRRREK